VRNLATNKSSIEPARQVRRLATEKPRRPYLIKGLRPNWSERYPKRSEKTPAEMEYTGTALPT
jgi:hypothetical protein